MLEDGRFDFALNSWLLWSRWWDDLDTSEMAYIHFDGKLGVRRFIGTIFRKFPAIPTVNPRWINLNWEAADHLNPTARWRLTYNNEILLLIFLVNIREILTYPDVEAHMFCMANNFEVSIIQRDNQKSKSWSDQHWRYSRGSFYANRWANSFTCRKGEQQTQKEIIHNGEKNSNLYPISKHIKKYFRYRNLWMIFWLRTEN
jgi:hypothetical protein